MAARPHILVVNGRKVRQPVFVIGAPYSGTDTLARALKRSAGFHMTIRSRATALTALLRRLEQLLQLLARHGKSRAATFGLGSRALQWDTFG